jgi:hypothetical protein
MNSYFFGITKEEKENILDQHKKPYDGYVTQYVKPELQPLYVQDFANDKEGITVNNKGEVKHHTYMGINEDVFSGSHGFEPEESFEEVETTEQLDMIGDGPNDLVHGTMDDENDEFEEIDLTDFEGIDEEIIEPLQEQVQKTLDMFKRFKKY